MSLCGWHFYFLRKSKTHVGVGEINNILCMLFFTCSLARGSHNFALFFWVDTSLNCVHFPKRDSVGRNSDYFLILVTWKQVQRRKLVLLLIWFGLCLQHDEDSFLSLSFLKVPMRSEADSWGADTANVAQVGERKRERQSERATERRDENERKSASDRKRQTERERDGRWHIISHPNLSVCKPKGITAMQAHKSCVWQQSFTALEDGERERERERERENGSYWECMQSQRDLAP